MKPINIFKYLDYRTFLKEYCVMRKDENTQFSYTLWGIEADIKNRSYLRLVVNGHRNLSEAGINKVLPTLRLNKKEQNYFINLVRFNQAKTIDEKDRQFVILRQLSLKKTSKVQDSYSFLSSHWFPKIQVILGLNDIDRSSGAISKMLDLPINQLSKYLDVLKEQNMAKCIDGQWISKSNNFYVEDDSCGNFAIQSFHKKSLEKAIDAISEDPKKRYLNSVLVALSADQYKKINSEISDFTDSLLIKYSQKSSGINKKIFQINVNNIPVSSSLIHFYKDERETNHLFTDCKSTEICEEILHD